MARKGQSEEAYTQLGSGLMSVPGALSCATAAWPNGRFGSTGLALLLAFSVLYNRLETLGRKTLDFWFNSDYLFAAHVYKDVFIDKFPFSGIKFSVAPDIFPDVRLDIRVDVLDSKCHYRYVPLSV